MTAHLLGLRAENFKRLTLVDVTFDPAGGVVAIMGENEAGKSSLLDALEVAIAGRKAPKFDEPVHTGAESARVIATFDDIVVTRTYKPGGQTAIDVKAADGRRVANAEELLRALYSHVALDPLAFSRLSDADQVATLLPMIGFDPAPLDAERVETFDLRTAVNRDAKRLEAQLAGYGDARVVPAEFVSVTELTDELQRGLRVNAEREEIALGLEHRGDRLAAIAAEIARMEARIAELRGDADEIGAAQAAERQRLATVAEVDIEPIRAQIANAETVNGQITRERERVKIAAELAATEQHATELTTKLDDIKARRTAALAAAKMPVPGLSIDDESNVLTLNGVPFSQASTGVKIRTGTAIAMTLNPELRVIVIRDASLLDAGNRAIIDTLAKDNGFLVLMEIADESMPVGVVIEEGTVKEVRP